MDDVYYTQFIISESKLEVANNRIIELEKKLKNVNNELEYYKELFSVLKSPI